MGVGVGKVLDSGILISNQKIDWGIKFSRKSEEIIMIYIIEPDSYFHEIVETVSLTKFCWLHILQS
jgi:hypothetical protein